MHGKLCKYYHMSGCGLMVEWVPVATCSYPLACMCIVGLSNRFCPSVSQSVISQFVSQVNG